MKSREKTFTTRDKFNMFCKPHVYVKGKLIVSKAVSSAQYDAHYFVLLLSDCGTKTV